MKQKGVSLVNNTLECNVTINGKLVWDCQYNCGQVWVTDKLFYWQTLFGVQCWQTTLLANVIWYLMSKHEMVIV